MPPPTRAQSPPFPPFPRRKPHHSSPADAAAPPQPCAVASPSPLTRLHWPTQVPQTPKRTPPATVPATGRPCSGTCSAWWRRQTALRPPQMRHPHARGWRAPQRGRRRRLTRPLPNTGEHRGGAVWKPLHAAAAAAAAAPTASLPRSVAAAAVAPTTSARVPMKLASGGDGPTPLTVGLVTHRGAVRPETALPGVSIKDRGRQRHRRGASSRGSVFCGWRRRGSKKRCRGEEEVKGNNASGESRSQGKWK